MAVWYAAWMGRVELAGQAGQQATGRIRSDQAHERQAAPCPAVPSGVRAITEVRIVTETRSAAQSIHQFDDIRHTTEYR